MNTGVETAFKEMLEISSDVNKAVLFAPDGVLASNMDPDGQAVALAQAQELLRLASLRAAEMGSQPLTQMVVETPRGLVFLAREPRPDGLTALAIGKRGSRVGLVLYDLKTCIRDAREAMKNADTAAGEGEEA